MSVPSSWTTARHRSVRPVPRQRGMALIVTLVLLVLITFLGVAGIKRVTQEERMATQTFDRSLAFQATEASLRTIEERVEAAKPMPTAGCTAYAVPSSSAQVQVCSPPLPTDTVRWEDAAFTGWTAAEAVGQGGLAVTPSYFVEYLGAAFPCQPGNPSDPLNCKRYRVTARVEGGAGRASVMLQSVYATD